MKFMGGHARCSWLSAEGRLLAGDPRRRPCSARRALELARAHDERGYEAWALRLLGEIALRHAPDGGQAREWFPRAMTLAADLGMRPLVAHCHLGLGRRSACRATP